MSSEMRVPTPPLPKGTRPLGNQVSGRCYGRGKTKLGFLECDDGTILKPVRPLPGGEQELEFYQRAFDPESDDKDLIFFRPLVPQYLGEFVDQNIRYIRMENIAGQFECPCIMDAKMGRLSHEPEPDGGQRRERYKYIQELGFQIVGQRIYKTKTSDFVTFDKGYGRSISPDQMSECLSYFFNGDDQLRIDAISAVVAQLTNMENWFLQQKRYLLFGVSLLIAYEGVLPVGQSVPRKVADVRMIDIGHVFPTDQRDENFLFGLCQFKECLQSLLALQAPCNSQCDK